MDKKDIRANLDRLVYDKNQFNKTIDTEFSQLVTPSASEVILPTVEEFFSLYQQLFFDIPQLGSINSHEYIIKTSTDYIKPDANNEDINALVDEINDLRNELLTLNKKNLELQQQLLTPPQT
jgi:flagellar biosynthesis/type III secretory pathway chaperone